MGKSTFSADLFYQYINKYNPRNIPFPINILNLGDSDVLDKIAELSKKEDACESILILDALDENVDAAKDIYSFKKKIELVTNIFKFVIITGRTQLFQDEISEPDEGIINQGGSGEKRLKWERIYVSPFSEYEIQTYLANKFTIGTENYRKAIQIVNKGNDLMSRPMILSFIDDLLGFARCERLTIVEIYKTIIDKWLSRECKTQEDSDNRLNVNDLYIFSKRLAVYMYDKWETTGISHITKSEYEYFIESNGYSGNPYSFRGRSLINRKSDGSIKFSHKSFWEFFLALDILENPGKSLSQDNLDMAKQFTLELNEMYLKGQQLIDVYHYVPTNSYIGLTDPLLVSAFSRLQDCQEQHLSNTPNHQILFNLWKIIVGKIVLMQCLFVDLLCSTTNNIDFSNILKIIKVKSNLLKIDQSRKSFNNLICYIQDSFNIESGIDNRLQYIQDEIEQINNEMPKDDLLAIFGTSIKDNILVFPNLFTLSSEVIEKVLSTHTPVIGMGFYKQESVYDLIKRILEKKPGISVIYVINHSECLEDVITFIWNLLTQLKSMEIKDSLQLVVVSNVNQITIPYVCGTQNINTSHKELSICLTNMYKIASEIN